MKLKEIREKKGLSQNKIAKILKIDQSQISRYETGYLKLNSDQIKEICKTLEISADYLLGLIDDDNNKNDK